MPINTTPREAQQTVLQNFPNVTALGSKHFISITILKITRNAFLINHKTTSGKKYPNKKILMLQKKSRSGLSEL